MAAEHRSIVPTLPGVPSWCAVLIAVTFAAVGFAFDAGSGGKELTAVFAGAYVVGCIAAVLVVRQSGVFTAVIQPPLILFVTVPGAYFLFHGATTSGLKDLLINCGYPLIERFPLMFFTSAVVLLIGMVRWYEGMSSRRSAPVEAAESEAAVLGGDVQDLWASHACLRGRGRRAPRRGTAGSIRSTGLPRPARRPRAQREPAADGPSSAPSRHVRGTLARRKPRSSSPCPSGLVDPVPPAGRPIRRFHRPSRVVGPVRRQPANHASNRRRVIADRRTNGPIGTAGSTDLSRSNRTAPTGPTERVLSTEHTTRSPGCATAVPTTAISVRSTGPGPAPPGIRPRPGNTTSRLPSCAPGGSPGAARRPASRWRW